MIIENDTIHLKGRVTLNPNVKEIFDKYINPIPKFYSGEERTSHLLRQVSSVSPEERYELNEQLNRILAYMIDKVASDIEIGGYGTEDKIWLRIWGKKEVVQELPKLNTDEATLLIGSILNHKQIEILEEARNLDFSYTFTYKNHEMRFRGDAFFDVDRLAMNMRYILHELRPLEELEFPGKVLKAFSYNYVKQGLILITGVTGSGKSTTLDAIIAWHNENSNAHIVTIASPLEYIHKSKRCIIRQREVGRDVKSFHEGVVQALRQDLDIMIIGEMRDPATIIAALEVTDTGHKVFSTLHTSSAIESIDRIIAEVPQNDQDRVRIRLADVLTAIVSLKLVPTIDGKLQLAKEILVVNPSVKAAIKNKNTGEIYMMINSSSAEGMITMEQDLKRLYMERKITLETGLQHANNKEFFKQIVGASYE